MKDGTKLLLGIAAVCVAAYTAYNKGYIDGLERKIDILENEPELVEEIMIEERENRKVGFFKKLKTRISNARKIYSSTIDILDGRSGAELTFNENGELNVRMKNGVNK